MSSVRRSYKIRWQRVIICLILLMIVIGGVGMGSYYFKDEAKKESIVDEKDEGRDEVTDQDKETEVNQTHVNLERAPLNNQEFQSLADGEYLTTTGYTLVIKDGVATVDGQVIVNKTYNVPETYKPENSVNEITTERCNNCLNEEVMTAFSLMESDAKALGLNIYIASGYRSYSYQEKLYNNYTAVSGMDQADTYSARPGHSEHQTGICFDLNSVNDSFAYTDEGKWVQENAYLYGFIVRYPKGKEAITGYQYEAWHLRYVGVELALELYNNGEWLTLEEYYGISSSYS